MRVTPVKTEPITQKQSLTNLVDRYISRLSEKTVVCITSKIVSICEGKIIPTSSVDKDTLVKRESDWYLPRTASKYDVMLTIKNNLLIAAAGIDESNANGHYVLWPENPYHTASDIWDHVRKRDSIKDLGIIITDSRNTPMRWGALGLSIAWCGFEPLKDYIGTPDIFGRKLAMTKSSIVDGLAAAAVLVMGEGNEQTPFAIIEDANFVQFQSHKPTQEEIENITIEKENDLYEPFFKKVEWQKGESNP